MSTTRQSVTLTKPQADYLRKEAKRLGITTSDLIRRIIDQYRELARLGTARAGPAG